MNLYLTIENSVAIWRSQRGVGRAPDARDTGNTGVTLRAGTDHMRDHMGINPCAGQMNCSVLFPFLIKQRRTSAPVSYTRLRSAGRYVDGWPAWPMPDGSNW